VQNRRTTADSGPGGSVLFAFHAGGEGPLLQNVGQNCSAPGLSNFKRAMWPVPNKNATLLGLKSTGAKEFELRYRAHLAAMPTERGKLFDAAKYPSASNPAMTSQGYVGASVAGSLSGSISAKPMTPRVSTLLLSSSAVASAYFLWLVRGITVHFNSVVEEATRQPNRPQLEGLVPAPTQFAISYFWIFALAIGLAWVTAVLLDRRQEALLSKPVVLGLLFQGLVVWSAMFCYFFRYLCGEMHSYCGPRFDVDSFVGFGAGAFPVTFVFLALPMLGLLYGRGANKRTQQTSR